jgi:hypothetical protein
MVHVELRTYDGLTGKVELDDRGHARGSNAETRKLLDETVVVDLATFKPVKPSAGERYLRALPDTFRGAYFQAILVES